MPRQKMTVVGTGEDKPFKDASGVLRHQVTYEQLIQLYKDLDKFIQDCSQPEQAAYRENVTNVQDLIAHRMRQQLPMNYIDTRNYKL